MNSHLSSFILRHVGNFVQSALVFVATTAGTSAFSAISQSPMVIRQPEPPLVLLTIERDEKLFNVAYNDYSDVDGDGSFDVGYKPGVITYYGLFDSLKCYTYDTSNQLFQPVSSVLDARFKTCGRSVAWSGDFLNYLTTSRADALRKVFYGGLRAVDTSTSTVLQRQFIPQDAHVWGKEYNASRTSYQAALPSKTVYSYLISDYTPLAEPTAADRQHLFANATPNGTTLPLLRVLLNRQERIWNWVAKEGPVAGGNIDANVDTGVSVGGGGVAPTDLVVRVAVCVKSNTFPLEDNCKGYPSLNPTVWKPTGILHSYGENRSVAFGLLTGSYEKPRSGGVLRKNLSFFDNEVSATDGTFVNGVNGIVRTLDALRISQWQVGGYTCSGGCKDYGNPVAEMMYEGLRYFAGATTPTAAFDYTGGVDTDLGLPKPTWQNPFRGKANGGFAACSKPIQMVVSDVNPTFDSDELPGGSFGSTTASPSRLAGLNVSALGQEIWTDEKLGSTRYFIGESLANAPNTYDQAPTAKLANSFGTIRGIAPGEPTRQGSYYAASVARFGAQNAVAGITANPLKVETYTIALAPPIPTLRIPMAEGEISIAPFGKSVGGCNYGEFVAGTTFLTNRLAGFYFNNVFNVPGFPSDPLVNGGLPQGQFRVSFEDNEQGTDNDMDAIVVYNFKQNADKKTLTIDLASTYAAGCINQSLGFVIAGSTEDGAYLGVRDVDGAGNAFVLNDTPNSFNPNPMPPGTGSAVIGANELGIRYSRTFTASGASVAAGAIPHDPLWYAAKHGTPSYIAMDPGSWDANGDGVPDNYALVTDPAKLLTQITAALEKILASTNQADSVSTSGGLIRGGETVAFTTAYTYGKTSIARTTGTPIVADVWEGRLEAVFLNPDGSPGSTKWRTSNASFQPANARNIVTFVAGSYQVLDSTPLASDTALVDYLAPGALQTSLTPSLVARFGALTPAQLKFRTAEAAMNYLKGDQSLEQGNVAAPQPAGVLRPRLSILGDIVSSPPTFVGKQDYGYTGLQMPGANTYRSFVNSKRTREEIVLVGANDGMLHAFSVVNGAEKWAFIPKVLHPKLAALTRPGYAHQYYVNGDIAVGDVYSTGTGWRTIAAVALGAGERSVFAIDITNRDSPVVLWEKTASELGFVLGKLNIVRVPTSATAGGWAVVFGNGYESAVLSGNTTKTVAKLFIVDALTGDDVGGSVGSQRLSVPDSVAYNGMGSPAIVDGGNVVQPRGSIVPITGAPHTMTDIWVGDLGGNLWKFDLRGGPTQWGLSYPEPLFVAERASVSGNGLVRQPITAEPAVSKSFSRGYYVAFGTGKFFEDTDRSSKEVQSIYLLRDTATRFQLDNASITNFTRRRADLTAFTLGFEGTRRKLLGGPANPTVGWYVDLVDAGAAPAGERVLARPLIYVPDVYVGTFGASEDSCDDGSSGWFMGIPLEGGNRSGLIDTNGDGVFNSSDNAAAGVKLTGGALNNFDLIAQSNGSQLSFYGLPSAGGSSGGQVRGVNKEVKQPTIPSGRSSWRQIQ
jgi:type IV pilus assembly protein PilY1